MIRTSNLKIVRILTKILILIVAAKVISLVLWLYLPGSGVQIKEQKNYRSKYRRYDFGSFIDKKSVKEAASSAKSGELESKNSANITNMILKGLYAASDRGYVIVAMKASPKKTSIIELFETYQGYTLRSIKSTSAVFEKEGKSFVLELEKSTASSGTMKLELSKDDTKKIYRNDINSYIKTPSDIWRDISITEIKNADKIEGFKITKVRPGSKIAALGLKENDLIVSINNVPMDSYQNALDIYKDIENINSVRIEILRQNQNMELVYEID